MLASGAESPWQTFTSSAKLRAARYAFHRDDWTRSDITAKAWSAPWSGEREPLNLYFNEKLLERVYSPTELHSGMWYFNENKIYAVEDPIQGKFSTGSVAPSLLAIAPSQSEVKSVQTYRRKAKSPTKSPSSKYPVMAIVEMKQAEIKSNIDAQRGKKKRKSAAFASPINEEIQRERYLQFLLKKKADFERLNQCNVPLRSREDYLKELAHALPSPKRRRSSEGERRASIEREESNATPEEERAAIVTQLGVEPVSLSQEQIDAVVPKPKPFISRRESHVIVPPSPEQPKNLGMVEKKNTKPGTLSKLVEKSIKENQQNTQNPVQKRATRTRRANHAN